MELDFSWFPNKFDSKRFLKSCACHFSHLIDFNKRNLYGKEFQEFFVNLHSRFLVLSMMLTFKEKSEKAFNVSCGLIRTNP
ncbi:CLUMA_CG017008, isoform A [Clunio marinus]|uniref:CLUMA_CG017008, isoform A n=1 Tax=Clunio marinus TaxID=568069 RepID=A0A1J1IWE3_9DIPT|nr:CLUMA_CG017008, isoform A [Clunio marinus]